MKSQSKLRWRRHKFPSAHSSLPFPSPHCSIDWCERNYVVSPYIAEFWNTLSNSAYLLVGIVGFLQCLRRRYETRFVCVAGGIFIIGLGSAMFHGTLQYQWQMADELPMVWSMLCWAYAMYLTPVSKNKKSRQLAVFFVSYAVLYSAAHVYLAFTTTFQLMFAGLVTFSAYNLNKNCLILTHRPMIPFTANTVRSLHGLPASRPPLPGSSKAFDLESLHFLCVSYMSLLVIAVFLWLLDQGACSILHSLPFGIPNPQLHAWWHVLTAIDTHIGLQLAIGLRSLELQKKATPKTTWYCGVWANVEALPMRDGEGRGTKDRRTKKTTL